MNDSKSKSEYILEVRGIKKSFGGLRALKSVDLGLKYNEVLAIVGDNGAGKSTLVKAFSGAVIPDEGKIYIDGEEVKIKNPQDAIKLGIQMSYQDLALVDCLNISTNLFMGREICYKFLGMNFLRLKKMSLEAKGHLESLGIRTIGNINEKVRNLSGGQRQVIAISRSVFWGNKIIILDEPTGALGVRESKKVLDLIKTLKSKNISVIIISHNLNHVFSIADRIVVLRHGEKVGEKEIKDTDGDEVVKMITGAEFAGKELK
ncbi:MAG: sugar ABC transporter ATP-binding protein [Actinobacteria bacterium]|nr:sugar ABC transporter ATP-binding protein [Actinomycetota bacterium]